jgi:hypothetical protein
MPTEQCCWTSLLETARAFHNITIADPEVKLSCPTTTKRDAVVAAGECLRAAIAALAQQRVPDAVRELPGEWREQAASIESTAAWHSAAGNHWRANVFAAYAVSRRALADDLERALASAEGNAVDLVQFRYAVEGWRDCARALAKVCDRPADCAYAEAESVRLLALIDQQQEALGNGE